MFPFLRGALLIACLSCRTSGPLYCCWVTPPEWPSSSSGSGGHQWSRTPESSSLLLHLCLQQVLPPCLGYSTLSPAHPEPPLIVHFCGLHQWSTPQDIVSDRGPQLTSQVWRAFCQTLGASVSLSSGQNCCSQLTSG